MGQFAEKMTRLRDDVSQLSEKRKVFVNSLGKDVADLRTNKDEMQARFRSTHRKMAEAEKKKRDDFVTDLTAYVSSMQDEFRRERKEMAEKNFKELNAVKSDIKAFVSDLGQSVSKMQETFGKNRAQMAEKLYSNLRKALEKTTGSVLDIKTETAEMLKSFHDSHGKMAREDRKNRQAFNAELLKSVTDLLDQVAQVRKEFAEDLAEARSIWRSKKKIMETAAESPEPVKPETSARTRETDTASAMVDSSETDRTESNIDDEKERPVVEESVQDDLTRIAGIGPGRLNQLNMSGVYTFKQLSESTPEALRELLGDSSRNVDVKNWIEQAKDLI